MILKQIFCIHDGERIDIEKVKFFNLINKNTVKLSYIMRCKKCGKKYKIREFGIPHIKFPDANYNNYRDFIKKMRFKGTTVINSDMRIGPVYYSLHITTIFPV